MKKFFREYTHIPAIERKGIIVLLCICCLLIVIWVYLSLQQPKSYTTAEQQQFARAAAEFLAKNSGPAISVAENRPVTLSFFDPNTLDSAGFITLGFLPETIHDLLNQRRAGKHFTRAEDLKPLYMMSKKQYYMLERYVDVKE